MAWRSAAMLAALMALTACGGGEPAAVEEGEGEDKTPVSSSEAAREESLSREVDPDKTQVRITASGIAFDTDRLVAPADQPFQIVLDNQDDLEHNVAVFETISGVPVFRHPLFRGELIRGPVEIVYDVDALPKGKYVFYCDAHIAEKMKGDFIVR
ncbi:MAG TPA: cupredoxin domain-containing protein [Actinomycetota bacterium]